MNLTVNMCVTVILLTAIKPIENSIQMLNSNYLHLIIS